jgi:microcystin synthetase protein McyG
VAKDPRAKLQRLMDRYPTAGAEIALLHGCGSNLAATLRGQCDPMQLLVPQGDLSLLSRLYQDSVSARMKSIMASFRRRWKVKLTGRSRCRDRSRTGVHRPHLATASCTKPNTPLPMYRIFYGVCRTEISVRFLRYATLDIERDPLSQGLRHGHDLRGAANVPACDQRGNGRWRMLGIAGARRCLDYVGRNAPLRFGSNLWVD